MANAQAAGYDGVIVFNEGQPGRTDVLTNVTLGEPVDIPVVGVSFDDGAALYAAAESGPVIVDLETDTRVDTVTTSNVIADSSAGNRDKVVVVGAHLDSVAEGPGINDNGSGTATILETAIQMSKLGIKPRQQLRFAFWGAEESGLLGIDLLRQQAHRGRRDLLDLREPELRHARFTELRPLRLRRRRLR